VYQFNIKKHELEFIKPAKTSRNVFEKRTIFLIELTDLKTGKKGIGEAAPLSLLSVDDVDNYEEVLNQKLDEFCEKGDIREIDLQAFPSIRFGIETAILSVNADEEEKMFNTDFTRGQSKIPINGLVWMNNCNAMYTEALDKINQGFKVIKFKVGAQDFDEECRMLEKIRNQYSAFKLELRLDANGAFKASEALEQLKELSRFEIHSIEQPIAKDQWDDMQELCYEKPIDIALDEELIGVNVHRYGYQLLLHIKPQYIILKPNLIGGFEIADEWIRNARLLEINWWATSALESNVGLNAIAQWVSQYNTKMHQGLGTGALFKNNFQSKISLKNGFMSYSVQ
jgi:o-succinylbenzoate synthase